MDIYKIKFFKHVLSSLKQIFKTMQNDTGYIQKHDGTCTSTANMILSNASEDTNCTVTDEHVMGSIGQVIPQR